MANHAADPHTFCGWCGKSKDEVRVFAGPHTNICDSCCRLAAGILQIIPPEMAYLPGQEPDEADVLGKLKPDWTRRPDTDPLEMYTWLTNIASTYEGIASRLENEAAMLQRVAAVVNKSRPPLPEHLKHLERPSDAEKQNPAAPPTDQWEEPALKK